MRVEGNIPQIPPYKMGGRYDLGLWYYGMSRFEVFEIKPNSYAPGNKNYSKGNDQLKRYIDSMQIAYGQNGSKSFVRGTSWNPNGRVLEFSSEKNLVLHTNYLTDPGMIYYEIVDKPQRKEPQTVPVPSPQTVPTTVPIPEVPELPIDPVLPEVSNTRVLNNNWG